MNLISIDRACANHGDYSCVVKLSYDEVTLLNNATYQTAKLNESSGTQRDYLCLHEEFSNLREVLCYGNLRHWLPLPKKEPSAERMIDK